MTILTYDKSKRAQLSDMMAAYMLELNCGIPEEIIRGKLADFIHGQWQDGIIQIDLCSENSRCIGFTVYQIDREESDWCKRPGWGFIREFYVVPTRRRTGTGRFLAAHTERELRKLGATQLYLTSTEAAPFWCKCGWTLTETRSSNGQYILEK